MNKIIAVFVVSIVFPSSFVSADGCDKNIDDPATNAWTGKLISAIGEDNACQAILADSDSFAATSACNIFVGRVINRVYGISDFIVQPPDPSHPYYLANAIATLLQAGGMDRMDRDWCRKRPKRPQPGETKR